MVIQTIIEGIPMLAIPNFFDPARVQEVWRVPYGERAIEAREWAKKYAIRPSSEDGEKTALLLVDTQNTFCLLEFELFVGGRSGNGAIEDNIRLCRFIYHHLDRITKIIVTMDTHSSIQIFHPIFWLSETGENPTPMTLISTEDVETGRWRVNPAVRDALGLEDDESLRRYAIHYTRQLEKTGKYLLTVWPYHSMLGGIGHAVVSAIEEAIFFHSIARQSQPLFELKGSNPLTENYSVLRPEVVENEQGEAIAGENRGFLAQLLEFDRVIIAGQAKSHCVAWTVEDLLVQLQAYKQNFVKKIVLLDDCTSPVVVPGVIDFTENAEAAYRRFADAGMTVMRSEEFAI